MLMFFFLGFNAFEANLCLRIVAETHSSKFSPGIMDAFSFKKWDIGSIS